jgi:hypothetical protein
MVCDEIVSELLGCEDERQFQLNLSTQHESAVRSCDREQ